MQNSQNKEIVAKAMEALAKGDNRPFYEAMAEDVIWRPMVGGVWGDVHHGREQAPQGGES